MANEWTTTNEQLKTAQKQGHVAQTSANDFMRVSFNLIYTRMYGQNYFLSCSESFRWDLRSATTTKKKHTEHPNTKLNEINETNKKQQKLKMDGIKCNFLNSTYMYIYT